MSLTLKEQARLHGGDAVNRTVTEDFAKSSFLIEALTFDNVAAATGGAGYFYTYSVQTAQATAEWRARYTDYTPAIVDFAPKTIECKILGGRFDIDRVDAAAANGVNVAFQMANKIAGAKAKLHDAIINGDSAANPLAFDGLSALLEGTDTEANGDGSDDVDWSAVSTPAAAFAAMSQLDELLGLVDGSDNLVILCNSKTKLRLAAIARLAGYHGTTTSEFGTKADTYNGVPIVDLGSKAGSNDPIIPVTAGKTDIYVVRMGLDGFHAVSPAGMPLVQTYLPKFGDGFSTPVQSGEVEIVAAVALKKTRAAAVLRGVKL